MKEVVLMRSKRVRELLMTFPSYVWLLVFFLIPTVIVFCYAFKPPDIHYTISPEWTLDTVASIFATDYIVIMWRTLWLACVTTLVCLSLSIPIGFFLAKTSERVQKLVLLLVVMPFWSSFLVRIFAWKTLLHPEGFLKKILVFLHIVDPDTVLLYNLGTVLVVMIYSYLPFAILPIYAQSVKFNFNLIEAALDLGASWKKAFFSIFIPSIRRGIMTALVMVFIPSIGAYIIPDLVGGTESEMIGNKIAQRVFIDRNLPQASALSAFLTLLILGPMGISALFRSSKNDAGKKK